MKKLTLMVFAVLIVLFAVNQQAANAEQPAEKYVKFSGVITSIENGSLTVENEDKSLQMIFTVTEEVLAFNSGTTEHFDKNQFEVGMKIEAIYDGSIPRILIYPAVITPEVIVVQDEEKAGQVKVGGFDENLVSLDGQLKLNVSEETILEEGVEVADLAGKDLIVFYTVSTKSLPAQTTPTKVLILKQNDQALEQIISEDHYFKNNVKMIPLRKVAEHLGYEVIWNQATATILVENDTQSLSINPAEEADQEIINGKTYVAEDYLSLFSLH